MQRNSFIQMSKLSNVRGRITYISSHAKQENLYAVYETTECSFWRELALCNQHEFQKSGTEGKCIEARELIIALPEDLVQYEPEYVLEQFSKHFKWRYGVECISALHHNKSKTNYHIHLIFSERKLLDEPLVKTATRSMFYDENGKRVRTKREILDENGNIRKKCKVIKKGEIYEKMLFTIKDKRFKQEGFLEEVKRDFTAFINTFVFDEKKKLTVFDKHSPYLATKKIGKNNPKEEQIKTDNWARTEWNHTVDRALVEGISREDILQVKREEITEKVQESLYKRGNKPMYFFPIVYEAIKILAALIDRVREQFKKIVEAFTKKEQKENPVKTGPVPEADVTPKPQVTAMLDKKEAIPPRPEFHMDMEEYQRLQEIYRQLATQELSILTSEKEVQQLQQEWELCTSIYQNRHRRELQEQITGKENRIANMKEYLIHIVKGNGYSSVDNFMKLYRKAKADYGDYTKRLKTWGDKYGMKYVEQQFAEDKKVYNHESRRNR